MDRLSLIEHLKCLKEMTMTENKYAGEPKQPLSKKLKELQRDRTKGIFQNISFYLMYREGSNEDYKNSFKEMVLGLLHQSAKLIQLKENMPEQYADFVVVSEGEDINQVGKKLSGKVKFDIVVHSSFVTDCLKSLTVKDHQKYVLFNNSQENEREIMESQKALKRLQQEKIDQKLLKPQEKADNPIKKQSLVNRKKAQEPRSPIVRGQIKAEGQNHSEIREKEPKTQEKIKQSTNQHNKEDSIPLNPSVPWEPAGDRKKTWYVPPKNLASHSFQKNNFICGKLSQLQNYYKRNHDIRQHVYLRAITSIKYHDKEITQVDDIRKIKGLSPKMIEKVTEIFRTGSLNQLKAVSHKELSSCQELQKVWGIGFKKAKELYDMGIKTIEDLKKRPELITKNMKVGLKYVQEFSHRIPRDKVTRIFKAFMEIFTSLTITDKLHQVEVVGSYRRGKATCGDIDILICRHDGSIEAKLLQNLVDSLQKNGFITQSLTHPRLFDGKNGSAYMGVCYFQGQHHRIDIKHYPVEQYAFAVMYFTGSDMFNRQMRMVAHNKGLLMSDHGIKPKERNGKQKCWKGGSIPVMKTQQAIFQFLGQDYCSPAERQI